MKGFAVGLLNFILFLCLCALGLVVMLNTTILNPNFVIREMDKVDTASLVKQQVTGQFIQQIPPEFRSMATAVVDDLVTEFKPQMEQQARTAVYSMYDYLLGKSQHITIVINLDEIKTRLHDKLKEAFLKSPPPQFASIPKQQLEQGFEQFYQGYAQQIPSKLQMDETLLPPEFRRLAEQVRQYVGYYQIGYKALIGFTALLIILIILIGRQVRRVTRALGVTFTVVGAIGLAAFFVAGNFLLSMLPPELPIPIPATLLPQLLTDLLTPFKWYGTGMLAGGVILLIISFAYKPQED